ncbi:MAG: phosphoribosyltransferase [Acidobacteriota bacterium]|nr:phosphoribosyltransferase [Acidobacteriota bacterium]
MNELRPFENRRQAGIALARSLSRYERRGDVAVLALPRGGVPVGHEVAHALAAPLDVFVVRKLGVPGHRELAMGAIASGGVRVLNQPVIRACRVSLAAIEKVAAEEEQELVRRELAYRGARPPLDIKGKVVVLVDDGLATGSTMKAAVQAARLLTPARVVVAVPVGAAETCHDLADLADDIVCLYAPASFAAVSQCYLDFTETSDDEVRALLADSPV